MNKIFSLALAASFAALPVWAEKNVPEKKTQKETSVEFTADEKLEPGFLTSELNKVVENVWESTATDEEKPQLGESLTGFASAPKFGGFFIGKYSYSDKDGAHGGDGFSQRVTRLYVDGTILKDFAYRIQLQVNNSSPHMKDFFVEWQKYKEFKVKVGQFKRAFSFENPMNPWDVGTGDYSNGVKKLSGHGDRIGGESSITGGRDQGVQIQGDLFPVDNDSYRLIHYQLMLANGQGVNTADANGHKDIIGTIQLQPVKGLYLAFFGWHGDYTQNGLTVGRDRYEIAAKYDHKGWVARAEYIHSVGHKLSEYDAATGAFEGTGRADAFYATVGIPVASWFKTWLKYDNYRDQGTWSTAHTVYSVAANFRLHKNLMFQLQYNRNHNRTLANRGYNEVWAETYVRF